ncbi:MAG: type II secretion system protein [Patescibacteria group bacterium]
MNRIQNIKGFTIIEVVLVLAIAGLIFLMVFIALPALQAGQRDTARKSDVSNVAAAVSSYSSNNRGAKVTSATVTTQVGTNLSTNSTKIIVNPTEGGGQTLGAAPDTADTDTVAAKVQDGLIVITYRTKCGESTADQVLNDGGARQYTTVTKLEGGSGSAFCQDS